MIDDIGQAAAEGLDDILLAIQRLFCRHKPLQLAERTLCEKCGKEL